MFRFGAVVSIERYDLDDLWDDSTGEPLELFVDDRPEVHAGSYVIRPEERIPEEGTTSHGGHEISVILSGEVVVGTGAGEHLVGPGTLVVIPAGTEHYSENPGEGAVKLVYTVLGEL